MTGLREPSPPPATQPGAGLVFPGGRRGAAALAFVLLALAPSIASADPIPCAIPEAPNGVADLHIDLPYQVHYRGRSPDLSVQTGQVRTATLRRGCVRLAVLALYVPSGMAHARQTPDELFALLDGAERIVRGNPGVFGASGATRAVFGIEGAQALAGALDRIPTLVRRGVRLFGPVHAHHNDLADSATDPRPARGGLTPEGERFVRAVYAAGGLVDVSHASDEAFADVARLARAASRPIVATHSNARALARHPRNLTDAQLRAIAASGGIAGLNFHAAFLRDDGAPATVADVVRHARHMIDVMGAAHVAIGSDLDGNIRAARGLGSHAGMPTLARALRDAGISSPDVRAILGENALRVLAP